MKNIYYLSRLFSPVTVYCMILLLVCTHVCSGAIVIDHIQGNPGYFAAMTQVEVQLVKDKLHIAYGHTSHGSQLTTGMDGLVDFINGGGLGMSRPVDFFAWNNGGTGGALDLHDYAMAGDCGYYPDWVNNTTAYLNNPANSNCNVIIWSWCGQVDEKYANGTLSNEYLLPMAQLETDYPDVYFVYMTGHVDHYDDANNKAANQLVRNYCNANDKILFDFADIECYDPDGTFYEYPHDNCDYYTSDGTYLGNWAEEWQSTHVTNVEWYVCPSAHSKPLNANQKAYGAWALWSAIAQIPEPCSGAVIAGMLAGCLTRRRVCNV
jgi:hypothetical protein